MADIYRDMGEAFPEFQNVDYVGYWPVYDFIKEITDSQRNYDLWAKREEVKKANGVATKKRI